MNRFNCNPKEYQELVSTLLNDNHKICKINGLPNTFYQAIDGVEVLYNFDEVFSSFVKEFPHSHHMSDKQLLFSFKKLLQQQLDSYWYSGFKIYKTNLEIYNDRDLVNFDNTKTLFKYLSLKPGTIGKPKTQKLYLKLINSPLRNSSGMVLPYAPKAMYNFINYLCEELKTSLVVTNVLRSLEYQNYLIKEGHITPEFSSHLYGYSVDIEQKWYKKNKPEIYNKVVVLLKKLEEERQIYFIDLGHIWHVCLSPSFIFKYL